MLDWIGKVLTLSGLVERMSGEQSIKRMYKCKVEGRRNRGKPCMKLVNVPEAERCEGEVHGYRAIHEACEQFNCLYECLGFD